MPSVTAERLCPDAIWISGRMHLYTEESRRIRAILQDVSPVVEPLSIDEAFLDLTGLARDLDDGVRVAREVKERIRREQRLTASVGVAPNKFLAKVASDLEKPDGLVVIGPGDVERKLWPLPAQRLWGVGPRTAERLRTGGLKSIGDIARVDERALTTLVGAGSAAHLKALARGEDDRPVVTSHEAKSVSEERTYGEDLLDADEIDRALLARSEGVARELRREGLAARTVHIKVRTGDFATWTRTVTLPEATDLTEPIVSAARELFRQRIRLGGKGVRLLGVGVSGLEPAGSGQQSLFVAPGEELARRRARAADAVRDRLGERAVTRARLLKRRWYTGRLEEDSMAATQSFDVTTGCDLQEVDNAVNQALKELTQRYDFKGVKFGIDFRRSENKIQLSASDEFKLKAVWEVLQAKMVRRQVPIKNLKLGDVETAGGGTVRQTVDLQQGIPSETARAIVKLIKDRKLKKIQAAIQGDQVRISSPSRDELQGVIALLKEQDFGIELQFGNYRSQ
jgi:DNA polymerase IV